MERFDPEHFILISELTERFYELVEMLANSVQNFWRFIHSDSLEVRKAHYESVKVAEIIALVY
jgi:hypothetical protein